MYLYLLAIALQLLIAYINNEERLRDIKAGITTQVNHTLWLAIWTVPCIFLAVYNIRLAVSIWLLHGCVFPVFFNIMSKLPAFNLSVTTTAKYDRTVKVAVDWLNKKLTDPIPYSEGMAIPDLIVFTASIALLWLSL